MGLRRVHEYIVDGATKTARISGVFPIRRWVHKDHGPINYQQGHFYDDSGNPLAVENVPDYIRQAVAAHPVRPSGERESQVMRMCPLCRDAGRDTVVPSTEFEAHLIAHARGQVEAEKADQEA